MKNLILAIAVLCLLMSPTQAEGGIFGRKRIIYATSTATRGSAYQIALASAQYRAANRIHGHAMRIEAGHTTGVGYSSFNSRPNTCFGVGGNYAVVRGPDGWYATKVLR